MTVEEATKRIKELEEELEFLRAFVARNQEQRVEQATAAPGEKR